MVSTEFFIILTISNKDTAKNNIIYPDTKIWRNFGPHILNNMARYKGYTYKYKK